MTASAIRLAPIGAHLTARAIAHPGQPMCVFHRLSDGWHLERDGDVLPVAIDSEALINLMEAGWYAEVIVHVKPR